VGQNLHIVDDNDDYNAVYVGETSEEQAAEMDEPTATNPSTPIALPTRYPRRKHRAPTRYSDYVPISCVKDGTSS